MIERAPPSGEKNGPETEETAPLSPVDVADYVRSMSEEMAKLAEEAGLLRLTEALKLTREVAVDELARRTV
jgi:hypothetical protein